MIELNFEEAKERIKPNIVNYLESMGININSNFKCLNPDHNDEKPSMSFIKNSNRCFCHACGATYDIFDLYEKRENKSIKDVIESFGITIKNTKHEMNQTFKKETEKQPEENVIDYSSYFEKCHKDENKTDYFNKRGISEKTIETYNLGYDIERNNVVIPTSKYSFNSRNTIEKKFFKNKGKSHCFNIDCLGKNEDPVFITEAEFDALSIIEAGGQAIALGGVQNQKEFISEVERIKPKQTIILSLDNDDPGRKGAKEIKRTLKENKIENVCICNISGFLKDCNEALLNNRDLFIHEVKEAIENPFDYEYRQYTAINGIDNFIQKIKNRRKEGIFYPTGFKKLDECLKGGFYPGLIILGGISSIGKTAFLLQIADTIAKSGKDVIFFSLEMAKEELISRSLSRITFQKSLEKGSGNTYAQTNINILNGKFLDSQYYVDVVNESLSQYTKDVGKNLFMYIGNFNCDIEKIHDVITKHIKITNKKPLVIIDYLQIITASKELYHSTDKQIVDQAVKQLKIVSREAEIPIIAVSSFNRSNYTEPVNMTSFKESGAIEYTSDVLIGIQYKGMDFINGTDKDEKARYNRVAQLLKNQSEIAKKPGSFQDIEIKILKNRNGSRNESVCLKYCPMFNLFREQSEQEQFEDD